VPRLAVDREGIGCPGRQRLCVGSAVNRTGRPYAKTEPAEVSAWRGPSRHQRSWPS
jgi:hypothetical protein